MDVDELTREAQQLTSAQFAQRYPHLFLLLYEDKDGAPPVQFWTEVVSRPPSTPGSFADLLEVLPVVKAARNPYADRISIGRARNCDVVLRHPSVSKLHAHVRREPDGGWLLIDTGSHNGTSVGGTVVTPTQTARIASGDLVTLGAVTVRVVDGAELHLVLSRLLTAAKST